MPSWRKRVAAEYVQFSNHTQYGQWTGTVIPPSHLSDIVRGIANIGQLKRCDAVLSSYLGSTEQGEHILDIVQCVKAENPQSRYFCDPVMGHPEKGCIVAHRAWRNFIGAVRYRPAISSRRILELEMLCSHSVAEAVVAARELIEQGPDIVLVKHLARAVYQPHCI